MSYNSHYSWKSFVPSKKKKKKREKGNRKTVGVNTRNIERPSRVCRRYE